MKDSLLSLLGLARRAGRITMGNDPAAESMRKGQTRLLLTAKDLSARTLRGVRRIAGETGTELCTLDVTMEEIGCAVGRQTGIVSVNDSGFANKIKQLGENLLLENTEQNEEAENL